MPGLLVPRLLGAEIMNEGWQAAIQAATFRDLAHDLGHRHVALYIPDRLERNPVFPERPV